MSLMSFMNWYKFLSVKSLQNKKKIQDSNVFKKHQLYGYHVCSMDELAQSLLSQIKDPHVRFISLMNCPKRAAFMLGSSHAA
jgi:hypothetical protein